MSQTFKRAFAVEVVERLKAAGYTALWAGGCVRDLLLGRTPKDYDVATNARPEDVRRLFGHRRTLAVGESFGVIIVRGTSPEAGHVEVATFRSEGPYLDGRRPEHVVFTSPEEDAGRRDFTINGMFYDPLEQRVLDFVGGEQDLGAGIVRAIGDPRARMREDKLRMLRAVRFTANLEFQLDPVTADAIRELAGEIRIVSAERVADELRRMLGNPHRSRAMHLADDVGLLTVVFPELEPILSEERALGGDSPANGRWPELLQMLQRLDDAGFELSLAVLLHLVQPPTDESPHPEQKSSDAGPGREVCRRLRLSNEETEHVCWLVEHQNDLLTAPEMPVSQLKRRLAHPFRDELLKFTHVRLLVENADLRPVMFCEEFLHRTPDEELNPAPLIGGRDLIAAGLRPGPRFKSILETVRDAQLEGRLRSREEALGFAARLIESTGDDK